VISSTYEQEFLFANNQRSLLIQLFSNRLADCGLLEGKCICGKTICDLLTISMKTVANIFLNNYCKRSADKQVKSKDKGKRKLATVDK
jgi:hypothetical protein